jgi:TonB family protein
MRENFSRQSTAGLVSISIHVSAAALLLFVSTSKPVGDVVKQTVKLVAPILDLAPIQIAPAEGGGGGGHRSPLPAPKGMVPRAAARQFTPPAAVFNNLDPKLIMEPTIIAPPDANLPQVNMANYGDPFGRIGPLSNGRGSGGGIGDGKGGGIGPGEGAGLGPGKSGGITGTVHTIGRGVSAPVILHMIEPEYSDEARKAKYQGVVSLAVVIDEKGRIAHIEVLGTPGLGLEEKAAEAVRQWRFKPGMKDGKPVAVSAQIDVNFRLL